ncbi:MAG: tetratricopeptide repeat protein [Deltaproteobacteria bacterium]|jgi:tetratricopeptide (TPR) repeat protein|nr:tetratricopeptide repeat protein [Deltaproteobacteria bacterium]
MKQLVAFYIVVLSLLISSLSLAVSVAEYTKAIEQSPEDLKYKFYLLRGLVYRGQGNIDAAMKDFSISIKMRPTHDAYLRRGEMYFETGAYNIAEQDFTKAINMNPSLEAYKLRGVTYLVMGKLDKAVVDGSEIIKEAPQKSNSYNIRMEAYAQMGELELARKDARKALSLDRNNKVASDLLVRYPEKIELQGAIQRYRPRENINKYRVWANNRGFAFTIKPDAEEVDKESTDSR